MPPRAQRRREGVQGDADEFKADFWAVFDDVDAQPGDAAVAQARRHVDEFAAKWQSRYPGAVACVTDDFDHLVAYLHFPKAHWRRIRHSNLISGAPSARPAGGSR